MLESMPPPVTLPKPQLGHLEEVIATIRNASATPGGREALVKFIMNPESPYIDKLAPLVEDAEDLESTHDLHQLCNIMKHLILLNDNSIIEYVVTDNVIMGVLGALECEWKLLRL
jgi:protein phosphatase-4 regulatory subunit 3